MERGLNKREKMNLSSFISEVLVLSLYDENSIIQNNYPSTAFIVPLRVSVYGAGIVSVILMKRKSLSHRQRHMHTHTYTYTFESHALLG